MPRFTIDSFKKMRPGDFVKMNDQQLTELLEKARKKFDARQKSFYLKRNKDVVSQALEIAENYYEKVPRKDINTMSRNQKLAEAFKIQDFFSAKSSEVREARRENRDQDKRIFGVGRFGRPEKTMTKQQRRDFWKAYDEYNNIYKADEHNFTSTRLQQVLASMRVETGQGEAIDLDLFEKLHSFVEQNKKVDDYGPNVFSGRRND